MAVVVVVRSGRVPDDGVVLHVDARAEALTIAQRWQRAHPEDRVTMLTAELVPLAEFGGGQSRVAQSGKDASGTLS